MEMKGERTSTHRSQDSVFAAAPATCGELFQGTLQGEPCLVSLPIDRWVVVELVPRRDRSGWELAPEKVKSERALDLAVEQWALTKGGSIHWHRDLPVAKGYGSSTADIGAVLRASSWLAGRQWDPWDATQWAIEIEPTDSSLLPGLALLDHRRGRWWEPLGPAPELDIVVVDTGGRVNSVAFNQMDYRAYAEAFGRRHDEIFEVLVDGLESGDLEGIGWAATKSACFQQQVLPKVGFDRWRQLAQETGAVGVNVAHSGTLIGLLYPRGPAAGAAAKRLPSKSLGGEVMGCYPTVSGGARRWPQ